VNVIVVYPSKFKIVLIAVGALMLVCSGLCIALLRKEAGFSPWEVIIGSRVGIPFLRIQGHRHTYVR